VRGLILEITISQIQNQHIHIEKHTSQESTGTYIDPHTTTIIRETADVNTSLKLTSMLLNGKNYQAWAKVAKISLKDKCQLGYINGTRTRPITATEAKECEVQSNVILSWLLHLMEPNVNE
jgi:gag-polypeptide of LTR copia-type